MQTSNSLLAPPKPSLSVRLKHNLFGSRLDSTITIICGLLLFYLLGNAIDWIFVSSIWSAEDEPLCRDASGACWSVIDTRHRIIFFGLFPYEEHWRSTLACGVMIATNVASCFPRFWSGLKLSLLWIIGFGIFIS
ncbi:MAG: general L-amino acid transport system permease protein [Gammaproteobacteria bacterium]|jgi:general L-amino acid transport system permease protein